MKRPVVDYRSWHASAVAVLAVGLFLSGCSSIAKGVTEAVLESRSGESEDTLMCEGEGVPFEGIEPYLARQDSLPPIGDADSSRPQVKVI